MRISDWSSDVCSSDLHPVTTEHDRSRAHIEETLHAVADCGIPAVWFWPNVDAGSDGTSKGIRAFREHHDLPHVHFFKNLPPEDFVRLVYNSRRSEEHTSELQSLMRISYAVFCLTKKK